MTTRTDLGRRGEELAARFLESRGWRVVARNFRRTEGEVDIVASRSGVLSFIEVKTRRTPTYGLPGEAVTARKRARIRRLAVRFLAELGEHAPVIRFDVIEISASSQGLRVRHIEEAF